MRYLSLDFEGSTADPQTGAPVSLGIAIMDDEDVFEAKEWLLAPPTHYKTGAVTRVYDERARQIHGYTLEYLTEHGVSMRRACAEIGVFVGEHSNYPVVAYNAAYDLAMWSTMMFLAGEYNRDLGAFQVYSSPLSGPWQCAYLLAKRRLPGLYDYKLDTVAAEFDLARTGDKHSALEDCILAGRVFCRLREVGKVAA